MTFEELESEVLKLPTERRAELVRALILSLDADQESDPEIQQAWIEEAERRYQAGRPGESAGGSAGTRGRLSPTSEDLSRALGVPSSAPGGVSGGPAPVSGLSASLSASQAPASGRSARSSGQLAHDSEHLGGACACLARVFERLGGADGRLAGGSERLAMRSQRFGGSCPCLAAGSLCLGVASRPSGGRCRSPGGRSGTPGFVSPRRARPCTVLPGDATLRATDSGETVCEMMNTGSSGEPSKSSARRISS
jgi:hypothetical protein